MQLSEPASVVYFFGASGRYGSWYYANHSMHGMPLRRLRTAGGAAAIHKSGNRKVVEVGDTTVHNGGFARIMGKSCMQHRSPHAQMTHRIGRKLAKKT